MTRRDTILIACLINAGLLVLLFATATTSRHQGSARTQAPVAVQTEHAPPAKELQRQRGNDVDRVLAAHIAEQRPAIVEVTPEPQKVVAESIVPLQSAPVERALVANPVALTGRFVEVAVKRGDSLERIARSNKVSVTALMESNNLQSTRLQIGQVLRVPAAEGAEEIATPEPEPEGRYYTLRSGDNPWLIAMKFHIPLDDLLTLNDLDEQSAKKLKPGDRIRIR